jgi:2-polyprenyl-6-hydroxyphenyl methylase/3-demethylubiquinone-9 3-methyltransferase
MNETDLTAAESHFAFGKNWAEFSKKVDEAKIQAAEQGLLKLLEKEEIVGKNFLDIGCGSGLHALSALRLGAARVLALDIDADSVATTKTMLERHAPSTDGHWQTGMKSVFDLAPETDGLFDVVYSWGVLHHTGNLDRALGRAAACVARKGVFCFALYRRTWMDGFWRAEKRWYAKASPEAQLRARRCYVALHRFLIGREKHENRINHYQSRRGMAYEHDVHDWLGGWPYESISPKEVEQKMRALGFEPVREFAAKPRFLRHSGVLGSGCDEYVYRRKA